MTRWDHAAWFAWPDRLYRDGNNGLIAGVCAGLADYFGVRIVLVRIVALLGLCFFVFPVLIAYVVLALVLPRRPRVFMAGADDWRDRAARRQERRQRRWERRFGGAGWGNWGNWDAGSAGPPPGETLRSLLDRFTKLEERLARIEGEVTSSDFELKRKFRDIGG
jgi:phage shock protein C